MNAKEKDTNPAKPAEDLNDDDNREMDLFVQNSGNYCRKVYGGKDFDGNEIDELRKEIKQTNEEIKKIKKEWGLV
jgi:hypothetical protein